MSAARSAGDSPGGCGDSQAAVLLGQCERGFRGRVIEIRPQPSGGLSADEMESRLIEFGFIEDAEVEVLHHGPLGRDPIAVRVNHTTVALRRKEALAIVVEPTNSDRH